MSTQKHAPFAGSGITRPERKKNGKKEFDRERSKIRIYIEWWTHVRNFMF